MRNRDRVVHYRTNYLLGTDRRIYQNVLVWDTRHNSDHFLVLGCIRGESAQEHVYYLGSRRRSEL